MHRIFVAASCVAASCCFIDASRVTEVFFRTNFPRQCRFASRVINCQLLNLFRSRYMLTLLAVKLSPLHPSVILTPPHPAVIFHPSCWRSNSPLSAQQSSSTTPGGGQPHPSPPSGHLPPNLLAVKPSPPPSETGDWRQETRD